MGRGKGGGGRREGTTLCFGAMHYMSIRPYHAARPRQTVLSVLTHTTPSFESQLVLWLLLYLFFLEHEFATMFVLVSMFYFVLTNFRKRCVCVCVCVCVHWL